jgi:hypothetical protein
MKTACNGWWQSWHLAVDRTMMTPDLKSNRKYKSQKTAGTSGSRSDDDYYLLEIGQTIFKAAIFKATKVTSL